MKEFASKRMTTQVPGPNKSHHRIHL